ncbi:hypothetical protein VSR01_16330 [Actinacidiphila sp. DG2A-62]|uniref:hypothetical protein n=1 Tax=Actinacidiphila sp. DG2A-62 TaxID=3108821 RepID=UPI002DB5D510|nr:hypothetical protein [Actinacidiphila sp. DG2A-62]MEC3995013.1 hypothetical protein [Actinacidiphila sp. DG2A-62]
MTVRDEITGLFRGVPVKAIRRDIALGTHVLVRAGARHLRRGVTTAVRAAAARPAPPVPAASAAPAAKTGLSDEPADTAAATTAAAAPAQTGKQAPAAPAKKPAKADTGEAVALAVLTLGAVAAAAGGFLGPLAHRLAPYLTARHVLDAVALFAAAWSVAAYFAARRHPHYKPRRTGPAPAAAQPPAESADDASEPDGEDLVERDRAALLDLLEKVTRGRNGVHLDELFLHTSRHPYFATVPRPQLGALLRAFGVAVPRSLTVGGISGRTGVRRADVLALLPTVAKASPDPLSLPLSTPSDLLESRTTLGHSRPGSRPTESPLHAPQPEGK